MLDWVDFKEGMRQCVASRHRVFPHLPLDLCVSVLRRFFYFAYTYQSKKRATIVARLINRRLWCNLAEQALEVQAAGDAFEQVAAAFAADVVHEQFQEAAGFIA